MPYYSELGIYTSPSNTYSNVYVPGPYANHSSIIAANFGRLPPSLLKPVTRNFRGYKPHLATISESQTPLRRINSPKILLHSSPKVSVPRPIKINTADIDVSVNRYRKYERPNRPKDDKPEVRARERKSPSPKDKTDSPRNSQEQKEAKPNRTIRRDRPTVRIQTIHKDLVSNDLTTRRWRDNFQPHELRTEEERKPRKTPGELLKEKFLIPSKKEPSKTSDSKKIHRRGSKKASNLPKTPSFHDICTAITTNQIDEELNPGQPIEVQQRQSRQFSTEDILRELRRNSIDLAKEIGDMLNSKQEEKAEEPREDYDSRASVRKKKKLTKKKSNESVVLSGSDSEGNKSTIHRRPTQKKMRRASPDCTISSDTLDEETEKAYQEAIRDISQVEIEQIATKPKPVITATVHVDEKVQPTLKAVIDEVEVEESPKPKKTNKFKFNVIVEEISEPKVKRKSTVKRKNRVKGQGQQGNVHVAKPKEAVITCILKKNEKAHVGHILESVKETPKPADGGEVKRPFAVAKSKTEEAVNTNSGESVKKTNSASCLADNKVAQNQDTAAIDSIGAKSKDAETKIIANEVKPIVDKIDTVDNVKQTDEAKKTDPKPVANEVKPIGDKIDIVDNLKRADEVKKADTKPVANEVKPIGDNVKRTDEQKTDEMKKIDELKKIVEEKRSGIAKKIDEMKNQTSQPAKTTESHSKTTNELSKIAQLKKNFATSKTDGIKTVQDAKIDTKTLQKTGLPTNKHKTDDTKTEIPSLNSKAKTAEEDKNTTNNLRKEQSKPKVIEKKMKKIVEETPETLIKDENDNTDNFWAVLGPRESVNLKLRPTKLEIPPVEQKVSQEEEKPAHIPTKRSLVNKAYKDDPDLMVFEVPEPEPEPDPEPEPEPQKEAFVPLQSNRLSQFMNPFKKPEQFDVCPVEIFARPKTIRKRHYPRPRHPPPPPESDGTEESEEESSSSSSSSEDSTTDEDEEYDVNVVYGSNKVGASTSSNDSGFDSGVPGSRNKDCDVNCHKKCEKLTANLCGVNQKLIVEAIESVRKGSSETRDSPTSNPANNPAFALDPADSFEEFPQSSTYAGFQKSGRITPPATTIPRFCKYGVDDFNFLKVLGKGSFGKVLLAELKNTEYYYAIKCLKKDVVLEDDDVECTLIERKVLALGTKHPYLCHLLCTFQTESHLFFVMEYLNGGDLMFHIQQSGRFPEYRAKFYGAEIVSGLKFLHNKGIVYRDLKLDNILLDFDGHVRIADFGMCKLQIFLDRMADTFCGTPDYMAPEIIKGQHYNQCVDWWSFGVLLYEMLIGQSPFSGCDEDELFWSICNEKPVLPRFLTSEASAILLLFLEKDATKRLGNRFCPAGDIPDQPFFRQIQWDKLEARQLEPPFKPNLHHPLDTQYFDRTFTVEKAKLTPIEQNILQSMDQTQFQGFSYTNPNATDK